MGVEAEARRGGASEAEAQAGRKWRVKVRRRRGSEEEARMEAKARVWWLREWGEGGWRKGEGAGGAKAKAQLARRNAKVEARVAQRRRCRWRG